MRYPKAIWRGPIPNQSVGGMVAHVGVVLHIMEGTLPGTDAWFHNPAAVASSHFGVGKDGTVYQWVDTDDKAWAQAAGNSDWISIEHEGNSGEALTPPQLAATAEIVGWAAQQYHFPLQISDEPSVPGIGWHGMGGAAWGGHLSCPGDPIKTQRPAIIAAAEGAAPTPGTTPVVPAQGSPISFEGGVMQAIPVHIPALDAQGCGYFDIHGAAGRVVSVKINGSDPAEHGYPPAGQRMTWESLGIGADERVVLLGGTPGGEVDLTVWVASA